ncbi:DUF2750 domain-containing protein [Capnocytophaga catalasegens]|uniref:DUF2750 domain-containing protein n=1 Tax=Capnocytophaga catalasegens TaxID=1004260 RepID=A0AAV5AUW3_9FLAO|nr:DUF2750 domain-containing protein [Capnocytophaga catalasegens]GIZ14796.1 hypothetical protein RCZ03_07960 [Capnocytophaga catalasegens]GJM51164.1 hypothetical protein RCZ15_21370 [Capnocytophaga catalasegens]GJM53525.1 hypothetical protein RCZ16_18410 [Capnocytophaga catalasegens]
MTDKLNNTPDIYNLFIEKVVDNQIIYTLLDTEEIAMCQSSYFQVDKFQVPVFLFWSDQSKADACRNNEWKTFQVEAIPLGEFMEIWCFGLLIDNAIVGLDFDTQLIGFEEKPIVLVFDLLEKIKEKNKSISFKKFNSVQDFDKYLNSLIFED